MPSRFMDRYKKGEMGGGGISLALPQNLLATQHTILESFENVPDFSAGGNATLAADTTNFVVGTQSLSITTAAGQASSWAQKGVTWDCSATAQFRCHVYVPDISLLYRIQFDLYDAGGVNYWSGQTVYTSLQTGWNSIIMNKADFVVGGGTPSWSNAVKIFRIRVFPRNAGTPCPVSVDRFAAGVASTPAICFIFDDCNSTDYSIAFPYLRSQGMCGTSYVVGDWIGTAGKLTAAQLQEMCATRFWDAGNHTKTHQDLTGLAEADQETELTGGKTALDNLSLTRTSTDVAYPSGLWNADTMTAMANVGMTTGRLAGGVLGYETLPFSHSKQIQVVPLNATHTLAAAQGFVTAAKAKCGLLIIVLHKLVASDPTGVEWTTANFQALVSFARSQGIQSLRWSELRALLAGPVVVNHR